MRNHRMRILLASAAAIMVSTGAHAATITTSYADWLSHAGASAQRTTQLGDQFTTPSPVNLNGGGSFTAENVYGIANDIRNLSGQDNGWGTWSGNYTGQVLYNAGSLLTLTLSGLSAFGFEAEPNHDGPFDFAFELSSGETTTISIGGNAGARFFGFYGGGVTSVSIFAQDTDFAYGNFASVYDASLNLSAVPLPSAAPMFGLALLGLAGLGHGIARRSQRRARTA